MNRNLAAVALAVVLVLAGCAGTGGTGADTPRQTESVAGAGQATATATPTPEPVMAGGHPATTDGSLNVTELVGDHLTVISRSESFTVAFNRTVTYVANDSLRQEAWVVNRGSLANQRLRIDRRSVEGDGRVAFDETRYANATTTCLVGANGARCRDAGVETRQIVGLTMETTPLETVAAPDYAPDGVVRRNGQSLYRYSASSFRSPLPEGTASELFGEEPTLVKSTLLVHPSGRIVNYALTYRLGGEAPQELALVYSTSDVNATTVVPPEPLE